MISENLIRNKELSKQLDNATWKGNLSECERIIALGCDLKENENALYNAIDYGSLSIVKLLVENGVPISLPMTENNYDPLLKASEKCNIEIIEYLIDNGADISNPNPMLIVYPVIKDRLDIIQYFIKRNINNMTYPNALMMCVMENNINIAKYLLSIGADFDGLPWYTKNTIIEDVVRKEKFKEKEAEFLLIFGVSINTMLSISEINIEAKNFLKKQKEIKELNEKLEYSLCVKDKENIIKI